MNLLLERNASRAGQRRLLVGLAAAMGVACGCGLASAQTRLARVQPVEPAAPVAPVPPEPSPLAPMVYVGRGGGATYVYRSKEDGRTFEIQMSGDRVTRATVDGEEVPADRIVREGRTIELKAADGTTLHTHTLPETSALTLRNFYSLSGRAPSAFGGAGGGNAGALLDAQVMVEPPPVMIGVSMMDVDATLRGHLGLEPGTATLISAVYDTLPASAAGLEPYDVIVSIDGKEPASPDDVRAALRERKDGDEIRLGVIHRGQKREATIKLEKYDAERFKAVKVRAIAAANEAEGAAVTSWLQNPNLNANALQRTMVGVTGDPNDMTLFVDPRMNEAYHARIKAMAEEQSVRAKELMERMAAGNAAGAAGQRALDEHTKMLEERLLRMEQMLRQLMEEQESGARKSNPRPTGGGNPPPPPMVQRNADT